MYLDISVGLITGGTLVQCNGQIVYTDLIIVFEAPIRSMLWSALITIAFDYNQAWYQKLNPLSQPNGKRDVVEY